MKNKTKQKTTEKQEEQVHLFKTADFLSVEELPQKVELLLNHSSVTTIVKKEIH